MKWFALLALGCIFLSPAILLTTREHLLQDSADNLFEEFMIVAVACVGVIIVLWWLLFFILDTIGVIYAKWEDARKGLCKQCGYDLRATPDRCPECGTVPAAPEPTVNLLPDDC